MREVLYREEVITLDASGNGSRTIGPAKRFETWTIERMVTSGTSTVEPTLNIYRAAVAVATPSDFTPFGNSDISETTTHFGLRDGEKMTIAYTGGTVGAQMRLRIEGWIDYRGREVA